MPRYGRKRGYPIAMLIGIEGDQAFIWSIYSESVKPEGKIQGGNEYNFNESIITFIHPRLKHGVKGVLVAATEKKDYENFMKHISRHHGWLLNEKGLNRLIFEHVLEPAVNPKQVRNLVKSHGFREKLVEVYSEDVQQAMTVLEKRLSNPDEIEALLFTLKEVEDAVYGDRESPEYILVTESFMSQYKQRTQRLLQVAANKDIKTKIIKADMTSGERIAQFGGLVCILKM